MGQLDYETAAERFSGILEQYPTGPFADEASLRLAQCYDHDNLTQQAARQFRKVLSFRAAGSRAGTHYAADALLGLGTLALQQGRPEEAGKLFDRLIDSHPDSPLILAAQFRRGRAWFEQGDYDRALAVLNGNGDQYKDGPLEDDVAYWIAKCRLRQGHFADAAGRFARAIEQFPSSELLAVMHYDRAIALVRSGDSEDGIGALELFRKRFPHHALAGDALYLLASAQHDQRHYDKSQAHCRVFLERYPSHELAAAITLPFSRESFSDDTLRGVGRRLPPLPYAVPAGFAGHQGEVPPGHGALPPRALRRGGAAAWGGGKRGFRRTLSIRVVRTWRHPLSARRVEESGAFPE